MELFGNFSHSSFWQCTCCILGRFDRVPLFNWVQVGILSFTLPDTNISHENRPLEVWRFLLETIIFRGELLVSGSVFLINTPWNNSSQKMQWYTHPKLNTSHLKNDEKGRLPGDSKCPFHPLVGGHLNPWNGHLTIPKRALWITR